MALNKLGELKNSETGEVLAIMFGPPNALTQDDALSQGLYVLSETIIRGLHPDHRGGGLGGEFGYGVEFENDVFQMFPYYWGDCDCEGECVEGCPCIRPNFLHKASGFTVDWYKWIGRGMEASKKITFGEWHKILTECYESLPQEARDKAEAERAYESTPEFQAAQAERDRRMYEAVRKMIQEDGASDT